MFRPGGYGFCFDPDGTKQEHDTFTCFHCQFVVMVPPKCNPDDLGGMCRICMNMICPRCVNKGVCTPFEKKLEQAEAKRRFHAVFGRI